MYSIYIKYFFFDCLNNKFVYLLNIKICLQSHQLSSIGLTFKYNYIGKALDARVTPTVYEIALGKYRKSSIC